MQEYSASALYSTAASRAGLIVRRFSDRRRNEMFVPGNRRN
jgi:hypothetical protein